jgi:hypothetical protein
LGGLREEKNEEFDGWIARKMNEIRNQKRDEEIERTEMNSPISTVEMEEAIKKLKKEKATGFDGVANDELKIDGVNMVEALCVLCNCIFDQERSPSDWRKGIITLIHKQGDVRLPANYRGITLLSCVYKLFATILTARVARATEEGELGTPVLDDAQGGFRKGRSCIDSVFALTELVRVRRKAKLPTYVAMLDIQKAYDRVYREALWVKMWEIGIRGRMWRMITDIYKAVKCAIVVDGEQSEWFENLVGLRQGCVLSPILFAIFIDSMARSIRERNLGVEVMATRIGALLIADDLALVASSAAQLQEMLDVVSQCSKELRFSFNNDKSGVMIFGKSEVRTWSLDGKDLNIVESYKYLGIMLDGLLAWKPHKQRILAKATQTANQVFGVLRRTDSMSARAAIQLHKALVLPVLEYGAEIWGNCEWEEAEKLQRSVARRILGSKQGTSNAFLMGELGWWPLSARRDMLRLRFWWKLVNMPQTRGVRQVYEYCREKFRLSFSAGRRLRKLKKSAMNWCEYTFSLLKELGMESLWWTEKLDGAKKWNTRVYSMIQQREERRWKQAMASNVKLELYRQVKQKLKLELYLLDERSRPGRVEFGRYRSGSCSLRIDKGREEGLGREQRLCKLCSFGIEDVAHVMMVCPAYEYDRGVLWSKIEQACGIHLPTCTQKQQMDVFFNTAAVTFGTTYQHVRKFLMSVRRMRALVNI